MPQRPNIILITTDQQRTDTINATGHPHVWTPNLDWLCDNGIQFTNAFTDCPVCMPARTTIMSGRYAYKHRVMSNKWVDEAVDPAQSLPGLLTRAGYQTRLHGKTHFGPGRKHQGFEHMITTEDHRRMLRMHPEVMSSNLHGMGGNVNAPALDPTPTHLTEEAWLVDQSLDFFETRDETRPFMLWLSFLHPHPPYNCTPENWALYQHREMPERVVGDWATSPDEVPPAFQAVTRELSMTQRLTDEQLQDIKRAYYATMTQVDAQLGRLFGYLTQNKMLDNTWIIFTSDHGEMLGDHYMGGKCVPLDASSRVPFIIRPPHAARDTRHDWRGSTNDQWICLADILTTACGIADCQAPDHADGLDLTKACDNTLSGRDLFYHSCMYLHAVREGDYKLCRETLDGTELLFNLKDDPQETRNLINDNSLSEVKSRLQGLMDDHINTHDLSDLSTFDPGVLGSTEHLPAHTHPGFRSGRD